MSPLGENDENKTLDDVGDHDGRMDQPTIP
jgi:hypothetical protein